MKIQRIPAALTALALAASLLPAAAAAEPLPQWAPDPGGPPAVLQSDLPESFDLRDRGVVTPVKRQTPFGSCWAFGSIAAAETSILSALGETYDETGLDLSEKHLAWFATHPVTEYDTTSQVGEGMHLFREDADPNGIYNAGGYHIYVSTLFSSGAGPVTEEGFPYRGANGWTEYSWTRDHPWTVRAQIKADILEELGIRDPYASLTPYLPYLQEPYCSCSDEAALLDLIYARQLDFYQVCDNYSDLDDWTIPAADESGYSNRNLYWRFTLRDGNILPPLAEFAGSGDVWTGLNEEGIRAAKEELLAGHGVILSFHADTSLPNEDGEARYLNQTSWAHYTYEDAGTNHMVCLVGWDDNYGPENFNQGTDGYGRSKTPPGPGAWIVKNSWGSEDPAGWSVTEHGSIVGRNSWGVPDDKGRNSGYFYLSYYDKSLREAPETLVFTDDLDGYSFFTGQYDYMPAYSGFYQMSSGQTLSSANVFLAQTDQILTSVSTRTAQPNSRVSFAVYLLDEDFSGPTDGTLAADVFSVDFPCAGYHRVDLPRRVPLRAGQPYAVVSTVANWDDSGELRYQVSVNAGTDYSLSLKRGDLVYCSAVVLPWESWLYNDGVWTDWAEYQQKDSFRRTAQGYAVDNFSIKAFCLPWPSVDWIEGEGGAVDVDVTCGMQATLLCAVYDGEGRMLDSRTVTVDRNCHRSFVFREPFSCARAFLLDGDGRPLCVPLSAE